MKKLICKLGFAVITLFISHTLFAHQDPQCVLDSLSAKAENEIGVSKLSTLSKLAELETYSSNLLSRVDDLAKEAQAQDNERFLLLSYNYRLIYYHRNNDRDSISKYTKLSSPIVKRLDPTDSVATQNEFLKIVDYTARGLFDVAFINQKRYLERIENIANADPDILARIYIGMGNTYYYQEKYKDALKYFELSKNLRETIDSNNISYTSVLCLVALCHINLKNYTAAIEHCDLARNIINDNQSGITADSRTYLNFLVDLISIQGYSKLKDFKKAKTLIDQLPTGSGTSFYQGQDDYYYLTLFTYYSGIKEYGEALKYTELGLDHLKKTNNIIAQPTFIKEKASLLYSMQHYKTAYDELLFATQFTDSIRNSYSALQLDELAIMYEVDLKDAEIAQANAQLKFIQTIIIALVVISILLLVLLLVVRINAKDQETKNKILFKQQEELSKSINYYKKMIVVDISDNTPNLNSHFQKLEDYMAQEEPYKNPDISREDIASALGTNRQYLSVTIKEETGQTFTGYINKFRLENARKQLLENDVVVIDDIIIASGFSSRPTFHRLFKEEYGMAPHELKRAAITLQNEIIEEDKGGVNNPRS